MIGAIERLTKLIKENTAGTVAVAFVFLALGFFINKYISSTDQNRGDCREEVAYWKKAYANKDIELNQVYKALAVTSGALKEIKEAVPKVTDSLYTEKIGKETKK